MTTSTDSNPLGGSQVSPNTETSANAGAQPSSSETVQLTKAEFDALQNRLTSIERMAQGDKDRAVKRTNERLDHFEESIRPLLEQAQQYIAKGKTVNEAIAQVQKDQEDSETQAAIREFAQAWKSGKLPSFAAGNVQSEGVNVTEVITDLGLDPNHPVVKAAFDGKQFTEKEALETAARLVRDMKKQPTPTTAQMPAQPASPVKESLSQEQVNAKALELQMLYRYPSQNARKIKELEAELEEHLPK